MNLFDKSMHRDEFRLRVLVTDSCNKDCSFCLNDFQSKPGHDGPRFIDLRLTAAAINAYCTLSTELQYKPVVTFSGGEPGLHVHLPDMVKTAKQWGARVIVVTNGKALVFPLLGAVDSWHVGVTHAEEFVLKAVQEHALDLIVQFVVQDSTSLDELKSIVHCYGERGIPVKLFVDMFSCDKTAIQNKIQTVAGLFPSFDVRSRFTGIQQNRGAGCAGCNRECVTLKALWVFPDGSASTCPQGQLPGLTGDWDSVVRRAHRLHKPLACA